MNNPKPLRTPLTRAVMEAILRDRTIPATEAPIAWAPELRAKVVAILAKMLVNAYRRDHP